MVTNDTNQPKLNCATEKTKNPKQQVLHSKITIFRVPSLWYCEGTLTEVLRRYAVTGCT